MPEAFVLIDTETSCEEADVKKYIEKIEGVQEANIVYGTHDMIVRIKAETMNKLNEIVIEKIRKVGGIRNTKTLVIAGDSS